jgi:DNA replication protein DnaC
MNGLSLITSNIQFARREMTFAGDATMAAGTLDGLLHHAHVAMIGGDSYCLRRRKRSRAFAARLEPEPEVG